MPITAQDTFKPPVKPNSEGIAGANDEHEITTGHTITGNVIDNRREELVSGHRTSEGKVFLYAGLCSIIVVIIAWYLLVAGQVDSRLPGSAWVDQTYQKKNSYAAAIQQEKVLVIAGSNALFGINSTMLREHLKKPVINLGVNAGLQLPLILQLATPYIKPGDTLIMPLEYPMYHYDGDLTHVEVDYILSHQTLFDSLTPLQKIKILLHSPINRIIKGYIGLPEGYTVKGLYGPHNIDHNGDQINSELAKRTDFQTHTVLHHAPEQYGKAALSAGESALGWRYLKEFVAKYQAQGVCILFTPPAFMFHVSYRSDSVEQAFYHSLPDQAKQQNLNYLGSPFDFMYPAQDFFDTNYHLTSEKRAEHTQKLIELLESDTLCKDLKSD